jgi:putative nucleotidyltransferase-like protein
MTPDIQFLIKCCRTNPLDSDIGQICTHIKQLDNQQLMQFVDLSHSHRIFPVVYQFIQAHTKNLLSNEYHAELKQQYMSNIMKNMRMTAELVRIMKLLGKNGIEALSFKGPTLAKIAYGDIMLRQYGDLDILVDKKDAYIAGKFMCENGHNAIVPLNILQNSTYLNVAKDFCLVKERGGVYTELHWRLFEKKFNILIPENIKGEYQNVSINNFSIRTFPTELLLVYLCLHGSKHGWERISWMCDVDRLIRSDKIDWGKAIDIAENSHSNRSFYLGLNMSSSHLQTPLPDSVVEKMGKYDVTELKALTLINLSEKGVARNEFQKNRKSFLYQSKLYDSRTDKIYFYLNTFFGVSTTDCQTLMLPEKLRFLYVFLRPFLLMYRYIKRVVIQA